MSVVATLVVIPRSAKFETDADWWGKMDPMITVSFSNEQKSTEIAKEQGKTPAWKTPLSFPLRSDSLSREDTQIRFDAFDVDGKAKKQQLLGSGILYLTEISRFLETTKVIKLYDNKNKFKGSLTVDFKILNDSPTTKPKTSSLGPGTLIVRPRTGNLKVEPERAGKVHPYVVIIMGDQAYQTSVANMQQRIPFWSEFLSFDLREDETMMVRVLDAEELTADDPIGEALINLRYIAESLVGGLAEITINLEFRGESAGTLTIEFEYSKQVFENPVKFYPVIEIPRGAYVCKKIKYSNPDNQKKTLAIVPAENSTSLIQVRNPALTLNGKSLTEIRLKLYAPPRMDEVEARLDIIVEEMNQIEETLIFRIRPM